MTNKPIDPILIHPIMKYVGEFAVAMREFNACATPENRNKAMTAFATIDWVETEVDPDLYPLTDAILTLIYDLGKAKGFKILDDMTDLEMTLLNLD